MWPTNKYNYIVLTIIILVAIMHVKYNLKYKLIIYKKLILFVKFLWLMK